MDPQERKSSEKTPARSMPRSRSSSGNQLKTKETNTTSLDERLLSIEQKLSSLPAIELKIDALVEMMSNGGAASATTSRNPAWTKKDQPISKGGGAAVSIVASPSLGPSTQLSSQEAPHSPPPQTMMNYSDSLDENDGPSRYSLELASDQDGEEVAKHVLVESDTGMINPHNK